ncbi:dolichyl-diphosphooligosaccharide--protein glycosyltransferase subunit DAD1-like [Clavelina lepadiformis]|uniref:dolichyl-diphosphooligosaccharide--protein glycosyltransferase subunit DAD1-like n=1 Tax=Clavelina lepadiformis TaxID=159417 RepID=UPI004042172B
MSSENIIAVMTKFYSDYIAKTPQKLKIIDAYLTYILITGVLQFVYCALVGTFPFNSFLSGFISCVASFVLAVNLRLQVNPENSRDFKSIAPERAFADFLFAHMVLHLVVINFIG